MREITHSSLNSPPQQTLHKPTFNKSHYHTVFPSAVLKLLHLKYKILRHRKSIGKPTESTNMDTWELSETEQTKEHIWAAPRLLTHL